jgi:hypothetical protein
MNTEKETIQRVQGVPLGRSVEQPGVAAGQWLCLAKKANFRPLQKLKWNEQMLGHIVCFRPRSLERRRSVVILYLLRRA